MKRVKKLDEDTLLFWCRGCEDYLPFEEFRQNGSEFGYSTKCFTCEAKRKEAPYRNTNPARLSKEKIISNEILIKLGYDLESELSVHEQFLKKHNL